jgi:hypothetical protein
MNLITLFEGQGPLSVEVYDKLEDLRSYLITGTQKAEFGEKTDLLLKKLKQPDQKKAVSNFHKIYQAALQKFLTMLMSILLGRGIGLHDYLIPESLALYQKKWLITKLFLPSMKKTRFYWKNFKRTATLKLTTFKRKSLCLSIGLLFQTDFLYYKLSVERPCGCLWQVPVLNEVSLAIRTFSLTREQV